MSAMSLAFAKSLGTKFLPSSEPDSRSLLVSQMFPATVGSVKSDWNVELTHRVLRNYRSEPVESVPVELDDSREVKMLWLDWSDLCNVSVGVVDFEFLNEECLVTNAAVYVPVSKSKRLRESLDPNLVSVIDASVFKEGVLRLRLS